MQPDEDIIFESRDIEIFNIPDTKTKLNTLQNYFFPRLQRLLDTALVLVKEIYEVDPLEKYTFVYRPSHRKDAKINADYEEVYIGISGRRDTKKHLKIKRPDGTNYSFHPSYLYFKVLPTGEIYVELSPFRHYEDAYLRRVKYFFSRNYNAFSVLLNAGKIYYEGGGDFITVATRLKDNYRYWLMFNGGSRDEDPFVLSSAKHYFPINNQAAIYDLIRSFAFLFPVLDACHSLAEGSIPVFTTHLKKLKTWTDNAGKQESRSVGQNETILELPELDSYKFVRAGLWYQVLMKDNWTCCSCKRSAKEHGIVLHVDHIKPRSRGGKDEIDNLQTLCLKCNIGKSNKDTTDLRS